MVQASVTAAAARQEIDDEIAVRALVVGTGALAEALVRLLSRHGVAAASTSADAVAPDGDRYRPTTVVLVGHHDDGLIATARRHGARVVVCSDAAPADLDDAVHLGLGCDPDEFIAAVTGTASRRSAARGRGRMGSASGRAGGVLRDLTSREIEVLQLLMAGRSSAAMAAHLGISPHTVRTHVQNILGKLGVRTRLQAATVGHRSGVRPLEPTELERRRARRDHGRVRP